MSVQRNTDNSHQEFVCFVLISSDIVRQTNRLFRLWVVNTKITIITISRNKCSKKEIIYFLNIIKTFFVPFLLVAKETEQKEKPPTPHLR